MPELSLSALQESFRKWGHCGSCSPTGIKHRTRQESEVGRKHTGLGRHSSGPHTEAR